MFPGKRVSYCSGSQSRALDPPGPELRVPTCVQDVKIDTDCNFDTILQRKQRTLVIHNKTIM